MEQALTYFKNSYLSTLPKRFYYYVGISLLGLFTIKYLCMGRKSRSKKNLKGKIIIVTGASDGIGKETALELIYQGATVIFACRDEKKTLQVINGIKDENFRQNAVFMQLDLGKLSSVVDFVDNFKNKYSKLHYLINNAGVVKDNFTKTQDMMESTIQINYYSPVVLSCYLLNSLQADGGGRIINVSSVLYKGAYTFNFKSLKHTIPEKYNFEKEFNVYTYGLSKASLNMFGQYLAEVSHQKQLGVQICSVHPGIMMSTSLFNNLTWDKRLIFTILYPIMWLFTKSNYRGTQTTLQCVEYDNDELVNGGYYADCYEEELYEFAKDKENIGSLMEFTKIMIKFYGQNYGIIINI